MSSQGRRIGVLFISSAEQPGADTFIHTLIMRSLDRSQFDVHVACSAGPEGARTPAFQVLQGIPELHLRPSNFGPSLTGLSSARKAMELVGGSLRAITSLASLALYVRRHRIKVLHSTDRPRDAVACALLGKLTGAKSIIHVHLKVADWMSRSTRQSMARVDALIGVSKFVTEALVDYGYDREKTFAVLNAIDLPRWNPASGGRGVRTELGIPPDAPVIVCAARLFLGKGQDVVIRALPAIRRACPNVRLLIVGRDDRLAMQTSFTDELKALTRELGVEEQVIFTGQRADMPAVMAAATLFALPSDEEPFGLVFAEAMAMRKPVVALDNGGTPEVVDHGRSGLLSARGDQQALVDHILTLLRDPALAARMGDYGRAQVEARFTAARMAADVGKCVQHRHLTVRGEVYRPRRRDRPITGGASLRASIELMNTVSSTLALSPSASSSVQPVTATAAPRAARGPVLHIPSLDGLRAVSFLIVFVAHSGLPFVLPVPGGFGVTVFFFLSGFLITTLLRVEQQATGRVSIRHFYLRRALRILPPFYIVLGLAVALAQLGVIPGRLEAGAMFAQAAHFANYWFIFQGTDGVPLGTVPFWSLAVEEHFYLIFPVLYLVLHRYLSRRGQAATLWGLCAVVCLWRCILVLGYGVGEDRTYMGSDTRFDSILFGCALAVGMNPMLDRPVGRDGVWKWALLPAGLALLLLTFTYRAPWFRETVRYTIQGLALTPVFVAAIRFPTWLPFRLLNLRWVAFIGTLSYTLYLTHQVSLVAVHGWLRTETGIAPALLALALSLIVSIALYWLVEKPCAQLRKRLARHGSLARTAVVS